MKNKIDVLFDQALDKAVPETWTTLDLKQLLRLKTEFANLIIEQCLQQCDIAADKYADLRMDTVDFPEKSRFATGEGACKFVRNMINDTFRNQNDQ